MADDDNDDDPKKQRKKSDRRGPDRRQGDQVTMNAMFDAYGFEDERKGPRRDGKDRRDEK